MSSPRLGSIALVLFGLLWFGLVGTCGKVSCPLLLSVPHPSLSSFVALGFCHEEWAAKRGRRFVARARAHSGITLGCLLRLDWVGRL